MKKIKFSAGLLAGVSVFNSTLSVADFILVTETEQLINDIAAIMDVLPTEVRDFYMSHSYSLAFIKRVALMGAELNKDSIEKTVAEGILPSRLMSDFEDILRKTWKDYLSDIPYNFAYWISYPFIWLAYWIWQGVMQAKEEIWD